jgi:hypothetical protein
MFEEIVVPDNEILIEYLGRRECCKKWCPAIY